MTLLEKHPKPWRWESWLNDLESAPRSIGWEPVAVSGYGPTTAWGSLRLVDANGCVVLSPRKEDPDDLSCTVCADDPEIFQHILDAVNGESNGKA